MHGSLNTLTQLMFQLFYGITPQEADASCLMGIIRRHRHIENKSHWVRDVVFGEDGSQVHCGNAPQVMAALRNTVIGLICSAGMNGITDACLKFAVQPRLALELMEIRM
jgi:hypothetical protein